MSTFCGLTKEYPQVALDLFSGKDVLQARAYLLSHVHTDHMVGLHSDVFARHLKKHPEYKLYCSEVTREFLLTSNKYCHLRNSLVALPIQQACDVNILNDVNSEQRQLQVTLLPAGHCPGSVMFLLEGHAGNVLYTGDFRLKNGAAAKIEMLHAGDVVKPIRSLYIDTTFFDPKIMYIPDREQSCEAMLRLIEEQIQRGPKHMVHFKCKAKYGYEFLFVEISKAFNTKVHVSDDIMRQYDRVPDLAGHMTTEGSGVQVHACRKYSCSLASATDVITIIPSTMWFNSNAEPDDVLKRISSHTYRLCFSFHSSYSEICDLIQYLQPENVYPNVIPYNSTEYEMIERLQEVLKESRSSLPPNEDNIYQPLGQLKLGKRRKRKIDLPAESSHKRSLEILFDSASPEQQNNESAAWVQPMEDKHAANEQYEDDEGNSDSLFSDDSESDQDIPAGDNSIMDNSLTERVVSCTNQESCAGGEKGLSQELSSNDGSPGRSFMRYLPKNTRSSPNNPSPFESFSKNLPSDMRTEEDMRDSPQNSKPLDSEYSQKDKTAHASLDDSIIRPIDVIDSRKDTTPWNLLKHLPENRNKAIRRMARKESPLDRWKTDDACTNYSGNKGINSSGKDVRGSDQGGDSTVQLAFERNGVTRQKLDENGEMGGVKLESGDAMSQNRKPRTNRKSKAGICFKLEDELTTEKGPPLTFKVDDNGSKLKKGTCSQSTVEPVLSSDTNKPRKGTGLQLTEEPVPSSDAKSQCSRTSGSVPILAGGYHTSAGNAASLHNVHIADNALSEVHRTLEGNNEPALGLGARDGSPDSVEICPSSQETYLSPSAMFTNNSQDIVILSSPESSDVTPDFLEFP